MADQISDFVIVPCDAAQALRKSLGLRPDETPRVAFISGPGDVAGTFDHWTEGHFDPRTPVVAYSTMFYTLIEKLRAAALLVAEPENLPRNEDPRFRFVSVPRPRPSGSLNYRKANFVYSRNVTRELNNYQPHIVLLGVDTPLWLALSIPKRTKVILTAHNNFWPMGLKSNSLRDRLKRRIAGVLMRRVAAGVCTSEETRRQVIELRGDKATGLYAEVPQVLSKFMATSRRPDQIRRILFLGRLQQEKGVFDFLEAFEQIADRHRELTIAFGGTGGVEDELKRRIARSPFKTRVEMLGQLSADDVHHHLSLTDLLVCPTRSSFPEGLALVVVEAAIHGVPAVLSSVVPAKELVADACIEFPADDVKALASALSKAAEDTQNLQNIQAKLAINREKFFDRSLSWGSRLYTAFIT